MHFYIENFTWIVMWLFIPCTNVYCVLLFFFLNCCKFQSGISRLSQMIEPQGGSKILRRYTRTTWVVASSFCVGVCGGGCEESRERGWFFNFLTGVLMPPALCDIPVCSLSKLSTDTICIKYTVLLFKYSQSWMQNVNCPFILTGNNHVLRRFNVKIKII